MSFVNPRERDVPKPGKPQQDQSARVSMKDVATAAGVSQSTVSFVLNGVESMRIGTETQRKVLEAAERLGYVRRGAGRPPLLHRFVGFMVDEIATSPFAAISIEGSQEAAWSNGVTLAAAMTGRDPDYEEDVLARWRSEGAIGIIYAAIFTRTTRLPRGIGNKGVVLLNCHAEDRSLPAVIPAEEPGGFAAANALINAGRRRIAFIGGEPWMEAAQQRYRGYRRALRSHGIDIDAALVRSGDFSALGGRRETHALMDLDDPPDAIFCANDFMALGCYEALKERRLAIPRDVAVMGYDDQEIAQHLVPLLSTVLLPHRQMGQWAVELVLGSRQPPARSPFSMKCPLVLRESHAPRPRRPRRR